MLGGMSEQPHRAGKQPASGVEIPGLGRTISRLGFGTAALMSRVSRRDSVRLLETALEEGITHFDTARSYGFGEAELAVGDVLAGRRDRITVTTKVGILPPRRSALLSPAKAFARGLLRAAPSLRAPLRRGAGGLVVAGRFDVESMTASLHTSLRHLRTDYVDLLLLHQPSCEMLASDEPLAFLERVQREGKVRQFGVAADAGAITYALEQAPAYAPVVQLANNVVEPMLLRIPAAQGRTVIAHSPLGAWMSGLLQSLKHNGTMAAEWSRALEADVREPGCLPQLALQWAMADVPRGVVLFSTTKPAHVREDAAALRTAASSERLRRFEQLMRQWAMSRA